VALEKKLQSLEAIELYVKQGYDIRHQTKRSSFKQVFNNNKNIAYHLACEVESLICFLDSRAIILNCCARPL
jgi:hypothetical protein